MLQEPLDLSPKALDTRLRDLDILNEELAELAGVDVRTVYRWLAGTTRIPRSVVAMLELMRRQP